jgi:hexokinase
MDVEQFLIKHKQSSQQVDVELSLKLFIDEMKAGLNGDKSSLAMFPTYLYEPKLSKYESGKKYIIIDAGGTNFRSALGYFDENGKAVFESIERTKMPASDGYLSFNEFYSAIAKNISRLLPVGKDIGFCFSYPVKMGSDKDGTVEMFAKEINAPEVVGTKVGKCTLDAVKAYDNTTRKIVILNDTVATLLGGIVHSKKQYSAFVGYIFGTGTNVCYTEYTQNIGKLSDGEKGRRMLINTECGSFNKFVQGDYDKLVAQETANPTSQLFEKMTSGKYLSHVIELCFKGAQEEGVFAVTPNISQFELKDVSPFLLGEESIINGMFGCDDDRNSARKIAENLIDRAAKMGAIANAAACILSGTPNGLPVAIVAEGTTFRKLYGYKAKFEKYLKEIIKPYGLTCEIVQGEELNLVGALIAIAS